MPWRKPIEEAFAWPAALSVSAAADRLAAAAWVGPSLRAHGRAAWRRCTTDAADDSDALFVPPPVPSLTLEPVRFCRFAYQAVDARWHSAAYDAEPHAEQSPEESGVQRAAGRLFLHRAPARTAVILLHGYLGGHYPFEERIWNVRRLYQRGADVALLTLPLHGARSSRKARFPCADPHLTLAAIRQSVFEARGLLRFFEARGTHHVGAMGMSLGGFLVGLLATLEPRWRFAVPIVPLADLCDFARGRVPNPRCHAEIARAGSTFADALASTSPFARSSQLSPDQVHVIGAASDRIAPLSHARELAAHFGARLSVMSGGHLLQFGRKRAFAAIDRFIERSP